MLPYTAILTALEAAAFVDLARHVRHCCLPATWRGFTSLKMIERERILGVILAGGRGRRMFAGPQATKPGAPGTRHHHKGLLDIDGRPILAHIIARLRPQVGQLILNANPEGDDDTDAFSAFGLVVVPDLDGERSGPLAGFAAAMAWAAKHRPITSAIVTVTTDVPFVPLDLVQRLGAFGDRQASIAESAGQQHPSIGLWPMALYDDVVAALADNRRRLQSFAEQHEAIAVSFGFSDIGGRAVDPFFNANTPDDLAAARALLEN